MNRIELHAHAIWIYSKMHLKPKLLKFHAWWKLLWMSRAQREKTQAMQQLLGNLLANAPMDKIAVGEGCSWNMTEDQEVRTMVGLTNLCGNR